MPFQGFLRSYKGTPPRHEQSFWLFWEKFLISDSWSRSKTWAFLLLLPFFLARWERTKKEGEREYLVALRWWEQGMEMHDILRTVGRCLDLGSRCWPTAPVRLLLLPHLRESVLRNSLFKRKEEKHFCKMGRSSSTVVAGLHNRNCLLSVVDKGSAGGAGSLICWRSRWNASRVWFCVCVYVPCIVRCFCVWRSASCCRSLREVWKTFLLKILGSSLHPHCLLETFPPS